MIIIRKHTLFLGILMFLVNFAMLQSSYSQNNPLQLQVETTDTLQKSVVENLIHQTKFDNFKDLDNEVKKITTQLQEMGYFYLTTSLLQKNNNEYFLQIELKQRIQHIAIHLPDEILPFITAYEAEIKENILRLTTSSFLQFQKILSNNLNKAGRPFDQFKLVDLEEKNSDSIQATLIFTEKKQRRIDKIYIKGYEKFPKSFVKYKLGIKKNQLFNADIISKKNKNLENIRFASSIKEPEVQFSTDSTKLYLYIEKTSANRFDGFIGFNNTTDTSLELNGYIDLALVNNLNFGESLTILYKNDGRDQQQLDVHTSIPYIYNTPLTLEAGLHIFRKDSSFSNAQQDIGINYQLSPTISAGTQANFINSSILEGSNMANSADFRASFYGLVATYEETEQIIGKFFNQKLISLSLLTGSRTTTTSVSQLKTGLHAIYSFPLQQRLSLYAAVHAEWLQSSDYIDNELYRFGGMNTIRGFAENSLVANAYATLATELRYFLSPNLYAHSVLDYGYYDNNLLNFSENLFSVGVGLGIETKAGILRLVVGNGSSKSQEFSFENTQIHLSLFTVL